MLGSSINTTRCVGLFNNGPSNWEMLSGVPRPARGKIILAGVSIEPKTMNMYKPIPMLGMMPGSVGGEGSIRRVRYATWPARPKKARARRTERGDTGLKVGRKDKSTTTMAALQNEVIITFGHNFLILPFLTLPALLFVIITRR